MSLLALLEGLDISFLDEMGLHEQFKQKAILIE